MKRAYATQAYSTEVRDVPVSQEGYVVRSTARFDHRRGSAGDWWPTLEVAFEEIQSECSLPNWDGEGAQPIVADAVAMARSVVTDLYRRLPSGTPPPDVVGEADGEICFSWEVSERRYFILSVGPRGNLSFTGRFGAAGGQNGWRQLDATDPRSTQQSLEDVAQLVAKAHESDVTRGLPRRIA